MLRDWFPACLGSAMVPDQEAQGEEERQHMRVPRAVQWSKEDIKAIYRRPTIKARHRSALLGGCICGSASFPFGPIGIAAAGVLGILFCGLIGHCLDKRREQFKIQQCELEKKRLRSLVRWAGNRLHSEPNPSELLETVILEFNALAEIAENSKTARVSLRVLDSFVAQRHANQKLRAYMSEIFLQKQQMAREDLLRSVLVVQTCLTMYYFTRRALEPREGSLVHQMETFLEDEIVLDAVKDFQLHPTTDDTRVVESMIYADAYQGGNCYTYWAGTQPAVMVDHHEHGDEEDFSEDEEEEGESGSVTAEGTLLQVDEPPQGPDRRKADHIAVLVEESPTVAKSPRSASRRKKKPFFKNWEDFMDFDPNVKHKMPITLSEFDLLVQAESQPTKGWDVCYEKKDIKVAKVSNGTGNIMLRAWATVPGVDLLTAFFLIFDVELRSRWDKIFQKLEVVANNVQGSDLTYHVIKVPTVTGRDFLQYRRVKLMEDGSIVIFQRSAEDPLKPADRRYIRAESYVKGHILRQTWDGAKPVLKIFMMSCLDVKGIIPKWLSNYLAPRQPGDWLESLRKAALAHQSLGVDYKQQLQEVLQKFDTQDEGLERKGSVRSDSDVEAARKLSTSVPAMDRQTSVASVELEGIETQRSTPGGGGFLVIPEDAEHSEKLSKAAEAPTRVLKRPFFKDWEDFMDFDPAFKHHMPITHSEFSLLLEKEVESMKGWDLCIDRKDIKVAKVQMGDSGITIRAWSQLVGVHIGVIFHLFYDTEQRIGWDKVFANMQVIDPDVQGCDILYTSLKPIPTITTRDFLQYRRVRLQEDGSIVIVMRSAEHPRCPETSKYIRVESYISGYVIRQTWDGPTPVINLFLMTCTDVKGLIPKWIVNFLAPKKPGEWVEALKKACQDYQDSNPGSHEHLNKELERFKGDSPWDFEDTSPSAYGNSSEDDAQAPASHLSL